MRKGIKKFKSLRSKVAILESYSGKQAKDLFECREIIKAMYSTSDEIVLVRNQGFIMKGISDSTRSFPMVKMWHDKVTIESPLSFIQNAEQSRFNRRHERLGHIFMNPSCF